MQLIFKFPTKDGPITELCLAPSELRHPTQLMDKFADFMPVFPAKAGVSDATRLAFITQLVTNDRTPVEIIPAYRQEHVCHPRRDFARGRFSQENYAIRASGRQSVSI